MMRTIYTTGYWSAIVAFSATLAYCIVQILQVVRVITFPADEILIYGTSLCIVIPFLLTMLTLHHTSAPEKRFWTHAALIFSVIYAIFVTANYVVQLATVVPLKMRGFTAGILEQTPHSLFWDFDALGYIFMGMACLAAVPAFEKKGFQKWVRISLLANVCVTPLISIVYFYPVYSEKLLAFGYAWGITAPLFMLMLALHFKKQRLALSE
jgi:hypothetical protein